MVFVKQILQRHICKMDDLGVLVACFVALMEWNTLLLQ